MGGYRPSLTTTTYAWRIPSTALLKLRIEASNLVGLSLLAAQS